MNARKKVASAMGYAAMVAATGLSIGLAPASAAPEQSPGSLLYIYQDPVNDGNYRMSIKGVYPMQQADAVGFITHISEKGCGGMHYLIYGDDGDPQYIYDRNFPGAQVDKEGYLRATPQGLEYLREIVLRKSFLNEDNNGVDEIYARVRFVDGDCVSRNQVTHPVHGDF
jgi:hypothetical protein